MPTATSIHDRFRGGALIPNKHSLSTLSDTVKLPDGTIEVYVNVAVAGNVVLEMNGDADGATVAYTLPVGLFAIPGSFRRALSTGTTATLSPAATVVSRQMVP